MRVAFDTNVLAYASGVRRVDADVPKVALIRDRLATLGPQIERVAPGQVVGELYTVLARGDGDRAAAYRVAAGLIEAYTVVVSDLTTIGAALELATNHRLQYWDALILATAADAGCSMLLSEDMQNGFVWRGLTIVDPLAPVPHPLLADLLAGE